MEYNTERKPLIIPEYGRHMQEMVDYCMAIEDREKRNEFAGIIIEVMGELNPHLRDVDDFQHKLWDQLFIMSGFNLDVDSPFPVPEKTEVYSRPKRIPYPQEEYKYKYYGKNIRRMIDVAISWEGEKQEGLIMVIANHMKKCYLLWNKDTVEDSAIFDHLYEMSDGKIDLRASNEILSSGEKYYSTHSSSGKNRKGKGGKSKKYSR
ncbi:MAG: DUF4290 domain-containing protein [Flavobacteriia bacterium]|nr:DUF4290 domain-containing protein [Flavobacteriia bacterium]